MKAIKPVLYDKNGPAWNADDVNDLVAEEINSDSGTFFTRQVKDTHKDYQAATQLVESQNKIFYNSVDNLTKTTNQLKQEIKRVTGDIRKAADDLSSGLLKVEKQANFSNLERYVSLLERAASSMQILAELEKTGKLEKIAGALK